MIDKGSEIKRLIYSYEDEVNNFVYIGLTKNLKKRHQSHNQINYHTKKYDTVKAYFNSLNKPLPQPKILEEGLSKEEAQEQENW